MYKLCLTSDILEEVRRNLVKQGISEISALKLIETMKSYFADALLVLHSQNISAMPVNEKDKHVLAAAVISGARIIVTQNLKDFRPSQLNPLGIEAQAPDDFLVDLFYLDSARMVQIVVKQAGALSKPSRTVLEVLDTLRQHAPKFVDLIEPAFLSREEESESDK